jgi:hypothetical protein
MQVLFYKLQKIIIYCVLSDFFAYFPGNFVCHFFGKRVDEKAEIW